jgi:hypothetical protein
LRWNHLITLEWLEIGSFSQQIELTFYSNSRHSSWNLKQSQQCNA